MSLPLFGFVTVHQRPLADGVAAEAEWMARAADTGRAAAYLWRGEPGLVVPRSCTTLPGWPAAAKAHRVLVRASGGGVVPQGPGLLNLSLVWRTGANAAAGGAPRGTEPIYRALCDGLAHALARLGIAAAGQAVEGSFCDGRFNLAVAGRKLVGTAQSWRRVAGTPVVLAHAVIVVDADPQALTEAANAFEHDLGSGRRYRAEALTSVALAWQQAHGRAPAVDLEARLSAALAERFAGLLVPREVAA
ncbi:MAG: lipoate--protein ligase [Burkholderiales bacterium]|nr:lipoate--protein ligase [Burkholderiales bacterium]MDE2626832.1 lipoate--protein ligase [Burkholderiales bacterium]